jgi:hypothetical protein
MLTVTDLLLEPPAPVHASVNVVLVVNAALVAVPLTAFVPLQPPEALQAVAF